MGALLAGVGATPTAARAQGKVAPVRDQLLPPVLIERSEAVYPEEALRERIEGGLGLSLTIDVEGHVTEVEVLEPAGHGFDHAAVQALGPRPRSRRQRGQRRYRRECSFRSLVSSNHGGCSGKK